jgi:cytochrome c oxidase subunit IV
MSLLEENTMKKRRRATSMILLVLHNVQLLMWGLILTLKPGRVFSVSFNTYAGRSWNDLQLTDNGLVQYVELYARFWGIQGILVSVLMTFICFTAYREQKRWSWIALFICATIGWGSAIILDVLLKDLAIVIFDVVPLLLVYTSIALSIWDSNTSRQ